jgi:hypothetical protein
MGGKYSFCQDGFGFFSAELLALELDPVYHHLWEVTLFELVKRSF